MAPRSLVTVPAPAAGTPAAELRVSALLADMRRPFAGWTTYENYVAWVARKEGL